MDSFSLHVISKYKNLGTSKTSEKLHVISSEIIYEYLNIFNQTNYLDENCHKYKKIYENYYLYS